MASTAPAFAETPSVMRTTGWGDYELIDSGAGKKLERYGAFRVVRPEPQCLWTPRLADEDWAAAEATFDPEGEEDSGRWRFSRPLDQRFPLAWREVRFFGRFTSFRHLGFFPEQAANWVWIDEQVRAAGRPIRLLNLFGYTGVASLVAAAAGAQVTHVDASKRAIGWARENAELAGMADKPVRWICEDARRYVQREVRRGSRYDGIILDPPKYGRGPSGEVWRLYEDLPELVAACAQLLAEDARFLIANVYAERISGLAVGSLLSQALAGRAGRIDWGELALVEQGGERAVGLSFFALERRMSGRAVTSLTNPTVKAVRALHLRKEREESGLFLAEGLKIITEAVELGHAPQVLLHGPDAAHPLLKQAIAATEVAGGEVIEVTLGILEKISRRDNPQMVIGVFRQAFTPLEALKPESAACWVALDRVRDPGNLGTVIRTADAAGCGGVILVGDCCDPYSVEAVRATMGSIFAVKIAKAGVTEFLEWRKPWPGSVVGTLLSATTDYRSADYRRPAMVLMGNEQAGLPPELAAACDVAVKIPMRGRADSLNLSVATGIMIYAATR